MLPRPVYFALLIGFNVFWGITYFLIIRRANKDRAYGVPLIALAANTAWDVAGAFIYPSPAGQSYINMVYIVIDAVLLYQLLRYWRSDSPDGPPMSQGVFYFFVALTMIMGLALYVTAANDFNDRVGVKLAFVDNFINSIMFVAMFYWRPTLKGQSFYIALLKLLGTGCASVASFFNPWPGTENSVLLPVLFVGITLLDVIYVVLVYQRCKKLGLNPWRSF